MAKKKTEVSPEESDRRILLNEIIEWLKYFGFENFHDEGTFLRFPTSYKSEVELEVLVIPIDRVTLNLVAVYYPMPNGEPEKILHWIKEIKSRGWGGASFEFSKNKDFIIVRSQFRKGDKGLFFYKLHSVIEYFRCWKHDGDMAEELGLTFDTKESPGDGAFLP